MITTSDKKALNDAKVKVDEAFTLLKKVWESHSNVQTDSFGAVTGVPVDADCGSDAPQEITTAMQCLIDAKDFIEEVAGE